METQELRYLLDELKVFYRNLNKDPLDRRDNVKYNRGKLDTVNNFSIEFVNISKINLIVLIIKKR